MKEPVTGEINQGEKKETKKKRKSSFSTSLFFWGSPLSSSSGSQLKKVKGGKFIMSEVSK